jgi:hypothetical protein
VPSKRGSRLFLYTQRTDNHGPQSATATRRSAGSAAVLLLVRLLLNDKMPPGNKHKPCRLIICEGMRLLRMPYDCCTTIWELIRNSTEARDLKLLPLKVSATNARSVQPPTGDMFCRGVAVGPIVTKRLNKITKLTLPCMRWKAAAPQATDDESENRNNLIVTVWKWPIGG